MRAVEDTGISILLAGYAESTRVHLDNIGRTIWSKRLGLYYKQWQDLEAGTSFTVHFRARLQVETVVQMAARQERLPTPIWRNAGTPQAYRIVGVVPRPHRCFS